MGKRRTIRGSRYGLELSIMLEMHWTWQELQAQPADLVDELVAQMTGRARADRMKQRIAAAGRK
jgi:hypothetical protein